MYVLANLLNAVAQILDIILSIYFWILIARALISWVNPDPYNPIVRFLYQATEPVLGRVRRWIPYMGGLDLSPLIVILLIYFIKWAIISTLIDTAIRLKAGGSL
ncbi:MAG: YggT family protein [Deltaproteobacteria bacterium]|nr:YggT family protein [Deltaproteobacteria bacterium]